MRRRGFLRLLAGGAVSAAVLPLLPKAPVEALPDVVTGEWFDAGQRTLVLNAEKGVSFEIAYKDESHEIWDLAWQEADAVLKRAGVHASTIQHESERDPRRFITYGYATGWAEA